MNFIIEALIGVILLSLGVGIMTNSENVLFYLGGGVSAFFGLAMLGSAIFSEARDRAPRVLSNRLRYGRSRVG